MKNFTKKLDKLNSEIKGRFNELVNQQTFQLYTDEDLENGDIDDYFDRRNQVSGDVCECFVLKVDSEGLHCVDVEDIERKVIGFTDLASVEDLIHLVDLMEWNKIRKVRNVESGEIHEWNLLTILNEINRDRNADWVDYDCYDWEEGWEGFIEKEGSYSMKDKKGHKLN